MLGPVGVLLGLAAVIIGILFQVSDAAAVVYCSVIGAGILLLGGGAIWSAHELRSGKPSSLDV